jgi:NAD(P)-dependent dehydrogenase (short-subunit alcohol dehydrogenase family)
MAANLPGSERAAVCVTGGTSGIGRAIAERLAPSADVFLNYHSDDAAAAQAAAAIEAAGGRPFLVRADVGSLDGIRALGEEVSARTGRLCQLIHAAGAGMPGSLLELDGEALDRAVFLNGTSLAHLVRELAPLLCVGSSVFYVTSAGARRALPGYGSLGAPKALAEHLVRYLAIELAGRGVRVNSISPGPLDTAARRAMFPETYAERLQAQDEANPSGRGVVFGDVAGVVELMSRPEFGMVQGQVITIDGGLTLS